MTICKRIFSGNIVKELESEFRFKKLNKLFKERE